MRVSEQEIGGVRHKGRELKARELTGKKTINLQGGAGKYYAWT